MNMLAQKAKLLYNRWYLNHLRFHYTKGHHPSVTEHIKRQTEYVRTLEESLDSNQS
jgi:hypothetical protein